MIEDMWEESAKELVCLVKRPIRVEFQIRLLTPATAADNRTTMHFHVGKGALCRGYLESQLFLSIARLGCIYEQTGSRNPNNQDYSPLGHTLRLQLLPQKSWARGLCLSSAVVCEQAERGKFKQETLVPSVSFSRSCCPTIQPELEADSHVAFPFVRLLCWSRRTCSPCRSPQNLFS